MDKKNIKTSSKRPSFFEIFKAQCSESDLGPISLNWFEELTLEAPSHATKGVGDHEHETDCLDQNTFKTPKGKLYMSSPTVSTPMIFKEQNKDIPLFASPIKETKGGSNTETGGNFSKIWRTQVSQSNDIASPSSSCLVARTEMSKTPQDTKYVLRRNLLSTPNPFELQIPKCISESLGAEADPDMSWSSSLATPPTLSPTVIIDRGNNSLPESKQHAERIELIMCSLFSKYGRSCRKNIMNVESVSRTEDVCAESDSCKVLNGSFGKNIPVSKLDGYKITPDTPKDRNMHDRIKSDASTYLASSKTLLRKARTIQQSKNRCFDKRECDESQENSEAITGAKEDCLTKELISSKCNLRKPTTINSRPQKHSENQKDILGQEEMSSSLLSSWSQVDFSDLEITQLEKEFSRCAGSSAVLQVKKSFDSNLASIVKEYPSTKTLESFMLHTSAHMKRQKLLNIRFPEKLPLPETSPPLLDICKTEQAAFVSVSESNSRSVENITSADLSEVSSSCCTNYSGQGCKMSCGHLHDNILPTATKNGKEPTKSGLKADSKISSLKRRPKKFIYIVNNTVYPKEGTAHSDGSSACPDLRSCISEVSETLIRNDGQTEEVSSSKKHSVEELLGSDKDCILANGFSKTSDNEKKNTENDFTYRSLVSLQKGNKKAILPNHIDANQLIEICENSFCAKSQKEALNSENSGNCFSLVNFDALSEANVVGSALSIQASKSKHAESDKIAQHFFSSCTQMAEDGYQSKKDPEVTAEESSELITPRKNVDTRQLLPLHIKENANLTRQRRLKCINQSKMHSFSGFKTASDKQIELSDNIIRKGKLLFKDIEDLFPDEIQNISNQNAEKHPENFSLGRKENDNPSNLSLLSDSLVNCAQFSDTQNILPECTNISSLKMLKNQQLQAGQNLTASQEAEVAELSNILEENGSQFDFTQFRKHSTAVRDNTCEVIGTFDKNVMSSEVWTDTDFEGNVAENPQRRNHICPNKLISTAKEFKIHTQSVEEIASANSSTKENKSFLPIVSATLQYDICGFSSLDAKEMNASGVIINKAESDRDMEEADETLAKFQTDCLNRCNSSCNYVKETDMLQRDEVNPAHMTKNYSEDTEVSIKEAVDKSKDQNYNKGNIIQITHTTEFNLKIVKKYSVQVTGSDLSSAEKKSSLQNTYSVNCGESQCNYNLQDSVSDLTCLTEVAKTEKESIVHRADEKENLNCNQKGVNNPESYSFLQSVPTVAVGNTVADKKMFHLLASSCAEEALDDMFFRNGTTNATSEKGGIISVTKRTVISENDTLCGSNHQETFETRKVRQVNVKGFQTASGKPIIITDESLAKARDLLSEETLFLGKQEKVGNLVIPGLQASTEEGRDEKIHNLREEFGKGADQREVLHSDKDFENPLNLLSNTVMHTETTREPCFSLSVSEADSVLHTQREKMDTANKTLLGKDNLPYLSKKNSVSKSLFTDSGIQHVSVTEGFGIGANQDLDHSSSRNTSNVLISSIKNNLDSLDSSGSAILNANYLDLKNDHSTLHHSRNVYCETDSLLKNVTCFSKEATSLSLNSENDFSIFGETAKNERSTTGKGALNLWDTNSLEKDKVPKTISSKLLKVRTDAFSTASGKTIEISQEALKKARQLLHEDCYKSTEHNIVSQPETERHSTLESCSVTSNSRKHVTSSNYLNLEKNSLEKSAEPQQSRSEDYHENDQALLFMDAKIESSCQAPNPQINDKCFDTYPSVKLNCTKSNISTDKANFFSTASGKPVKLSEESLRKARLLFSEMENDSPYHQSHVSDGDHIYDKVSLAKDKIPPRNNKLLMTEGKSIQNIEVNTNIPCGFSTASGKQVHISQKALQNVMGLLKEFDDDITGNGFVADQQSLGQDHVSSIKAPAAEFKLEDEISSKSKLHDKSNGHYLTTRNPSEKNLKIPTCNSFKEEYKQLTRLEENFTCSKEFEPFLKTNQTCLRKAGSNYPAKHDTITKRELSFHSPVYFQSPDYLEAEASESAKVFMEDEDLIDIEVQTNKNKFVLNPGKTNNFLPYTRKRCTEKENIFGEPPIKRKLLPAFDESEKSKISSLKVSTSIPEDTLNDRKKITYGISFKPMVCGPFSSTKEQQEVLNPNYTTPDQHLKRLKSVGFPQYISKQSSTRSSDHVTQFSKIASEEERKAENRITKKPVKVFVPPFKTKSRTSENKICSSKEWVNESINGMEQSSCTEVHVNTTDPEGDNPMQILAVDSECKETDSDLTKIIANLHCARNLQEMRIMKKQKQRIHPQPGNLYLVKTSATSSRIPLKVAVEEKLPGSYLSEQLYAFGISKQYIKINSSNAEGFRFHIQNFFSRECFLESHGIQLADGGYLIPNNDGKAGKEEFYRALCDTPGVDPKLISKAWVYNHYRWIVWKLAAMEVAFPHKFASKCLTPERVLLQLKYRYDVEVDKSRRSAIKRITERDDVAAKRIILCISKIISLSTSLSHVFGNKSTAEENKKDIAAIEVTDGWYGIRAALDPPLQSLLCRQKLMVGQKIVIHGAELVGSQDACTPLEAPESLMLKISANSTRCARWYAKLGYYWDPRPFCLPLSSLLSDGGIVGCIDVIVQRIYPTQWMEKTRGSFVFRNCRAEERETTKHAEERQKMLEVLLAKIQADLEAKEGESKSILRSRTLTRQQIRSLQDGAELYEAVLNAGDPVYMEGCFSEEQIKALNNYRQMANDKKKAQIEAEFRKAVESVEQDEHSSCKRDVTAVIKLRILDYKNERSRKEVILNIWRPSSDVCNLLKEGNRYQIFQVATSHYKGKSDVATVQLTATRKTQYQQLPVSQEILSQAYRPRECLKFSKLLEASFQPACSEVDLVGYIISLRKGIGSSTLVYMSDKDHELIAVQISADFKQLAVEDIIIPSVLISATNLQWQPNFKSEIPTLFAGNLSVFSSNSKEAHLQGEFNELRKTVQNDNCYGKDVEFRLMTLLQADDAPVLNMPQACGFSHFPSPWKSSAENKHLTATPSNEQRHQSPSMVDVKPLVSLGSAKLIPEPPPPRNCKKRKAMDLLCHVPSPPPVNPICTFISPSLKRAFQPPRSTQHERSRRGAECEVKKTTPRRLNKASFSFENYFVADEELAMISTQGFVNNYPEERGTDSVDKTGSRT